MLMNAVCAFRLFEFFLWWLLTAFLFKDFGFDLILYSDMNISEVSSLVSRYSKLVCDVELAHRADVCRRRHRPRGLARSCA